MLSQLPAPTPTIVLMGDLNFQDKNLSWKRSEDGFLVPLVHPHRDGATDGGLLVRQQAARLCEVAVKHSLIQQVDQTTHGREILDLIFSNDEDLVSSVSVEAWPAFTDHSLITAAVSYKLEKEVTLEEIHLLESGRRLKKLNFNKAPWSEIQSELRKLDWSPMVELADQSPITAHTWFIDQLLPLLEKYVPVKGPKKSGKTKLDRRRNLLWRKLGKIQRRIQSSSSVSQLSKLIQDRWDLEVQLKTEYANLTQKD